MDNLTLFRLQQPENHPRQGGFSRSALSDQPENLAVPHHKIHIVQHFLVLAFA